MQNTQSYMSSSGFTILYVALVVISIVLFVYFPNQPKAILNYIRSWSLWVRNFKSKREYAKKYDELFKSRDSYTFHIAWAKSRGDFQE